MIVIIEPQSVALLKSKSHQTEGRKCEANGESSSSHSLRLLFVGLLLIGSPPLGFPLSRLDFVCVKLVYELWRDAEVSINHTVITEGQTPRSPFRIWTLLHGSSAKRVA